MVPAAAPVLCSQLPTAPAATAADIALLLHGLAPDSRSGQRGPCVRTLAAGEAVKSASVSCGHHGKVPHTGGLKQQK